MSDQAPDKHRIMLPRALREKDPADATPAPPPRTRSGRSRRRAMMPFVVALVVAGIVGGALLLLIKMQEDSKLEDCIMQNRKNCAPLDPKLGR